MNRYFKRLAEGHYDLEDLENARRFISLFNKPLTSINFHWIKLFYWLFKWGQYRYSIIAYSSRQLPSSCPHYHPC